MRVKHLRCKPSGIFASTRLAFPIILSRNGREREREREKKKRERQRQKETEKTRKKKRKKGNKERKKQQEKTARNWIAQQIESVSMKISADPLHPWAPKTETTVITPTIFDLIYFAIFWWWCWWWQHHLRITCISLLLASKGQLPLRRTAQSVGLVGMVAPVGMEVLVGMVGTAGSAGKAAQVKEGHRRRRKARCRPPAVPSSRCATHRPGEIWRHTRSKMGVAPTLNHFVSWILYPLAVTIGKRISNCEQLWHSTVKLYAKWLKWPAMKAASFSAAETLLQDEEHASSTILRGITVTVQSALHVHVTWGCLGIA